MSAPPSAEIRREHVPEDVRNQYVPSDPRAVADAFANSAASRLRAWASGFNRGDDSDTLLAAIGYALVAIDARLTDISNTIPPRS